jgi:hypothetical protein
VESRPPPPELLTTHVVDIVAANVPAHRAGQSPTAWRQRFPAASGVVSLAEKFGAEKLARSDLFQLGDAVRNHVRGAAEELLAATLIFGSRGRNARGHAAKALVSPNVDTVNSEVLKALDAESIGGMYGAFISTSRIEGYGESFFTKYLYFLCGGMAADDWRPSQGRPLIYDDRVRRALAFAKKMLGVRWRPPSKPSARYEYYCFTLASWSDVLSSLCPPTRCEPDQIEYFLYLYAKANVFESSKYFREVAAAAVRSVSVGAVHPSLTKVVQSLPDDFKASLLGDGERGPDGGLQP